MKDRLNKLLEQLRQRGLGNPGQGKRAKARRAKAKTRMGQLGDAGEAMGEAEGELGEGDADGAVDSQGRALEAMRKGAQGLAQSDAAERHGHKAPASPAATAASAPSRIPIRSAGRCAAATMATTSR